MIADRDRRRALGESGTTRNDGNSSDELLKAGQDPEPQLKLIENPGRRTRCPDIC